jgi:hypothetical protein
MSEEAIGPVKKRVKVIGATYLEEKKAFHIVGECDEGDLQQLIERDALFPTIDRITDMSYEDIVYEMHKTAQIMQGKEIWLVFDPEAQKKLDNGEELDYSELPESVVSHENSEEGEENEG